MLKRFFTPKWQHQDPSVREQALVALDASNDAEVIMKLVTDDPSSKIRDQALEKLADMSLLNSLLSASDGPAEWCRFALRINQLSPQVEHLTKEFGKVKESWDIDDTFKKVVSCSSDKGDLPLTNALLSTIDHPDALFKIATSAKSVDARLKAVADIQDIEVLHRLLKEATHKQVLQVVRSKLADAKAQQKIIDDTLDSAEKLAAALDKLSKQSWDDAQFETKVNHILENWQGLTLPEIDSLNESQQKRFDDFSNTFHSALNTSQKTIDENKQAIEQAAVQQEALDKQQALCQQLENLTKEMTDPSMDSLEAYQSVKEAFEFLNKNWQQTISEISADSKVQSNYLKLQKLLQTQLLPWETTIRLREEVEAFLSYEPANEYNELRSWLKSWQSLSLKLAWPKNVTRPKFIENWFESVAKFQRQYDKIVGSQKKKAKYLNQKISLLEKHCQQRNLIAANKLVNYINQKLNESIADFHTSLSKKIENIQPQLAELRDWHAFATGPKKGELCEVMEKLSAEPMEPLARAKKVRELQQQWRELLASDPTADDESWERFKKASDIAYKPCLEYYAEKDKVRAENLQKRQRICETLEQIIAENGWRTLAEEPVSSDEKVQSEAESSGDNKISINWKKIDQQLNKINSDWKKYQPVPENERQSIQDHFSAVQSVVREQLTNEKQANLDSRCDLVEKAVSLLGKEGGDDRNSIEKSIKQAMFLQKQWKDLGLTFYKADREQWNLFRQAIDKVFAARDDLKKQFKNDLHSNQEKLKNITTEIEQLSKIDDENLKASFSQFETLKQSWSYDTELPRAKSQSLLNAFEKACGSYQEHFDGLAQRQSDLAFKSLLDGAEMLTRAEEELLTAGSKKMEPSTLEQLQKGLLALNCDEKGESLLKGRLEALTLSDPVTENQEGLEKLQELALSAEITLAIDSPEDYKEQRMTIQLEQLQKGIGSIQPSNSHFNEIKEMFNIWVTIGLIEPSEREKLESRREKLFNAVGL